MGARGGEAAEAAVVELPLPAAPAVRSLRQSAWRQVLDGAVAWAGAPVRFARLLRITKECVADVKERFRAAKEEKMEQREKSGKSSSGGGAAKMLQKLLPTYMWSHVVARTDPAVYRDLLNTSLSVMVGSILTQEPFPFEPYHEAVRGPELDYYAWGNNFFRSMVKYRSSRVEGLEHVLEIKRLLAAGENVILLANHQTEADPQVLSILLELEGHEELAERCIFVAGHKVTTDPLAVPFSIGRNLLTIFSKKYLDSFPPEEKEVKSAHNQKTVGEMQRLFKEGGKLVWVAPSGGRDRRTAADGEFEPAAFDASSVGLFLVLAQKVERAKGPKTHLFPLAMWTHNLVPPPSGEQAKVGESRSAARAPVGLGFGPELDVAKAGGRKKFPAVAEKAVKEHYAHLHSLMAQ
uniref:Phospholipid/glycerol acyltransferase domain-containing protein n=1 Tax=Alexandrium catenella TaxID=2925 RepID=A0A7S1S6C0_ALECA